MKQFFKILGGIAFAAVIGFGFAGCDTGDKAVPVTGVTLNADSAQVETGKTFTLAATVSPHDADNKDVTWSSSNTSVATVANGVVEGKSEGTATITVRADGNKTATCSVTVVAAFSGSTRPTGITLSQSRLEMEKDDTHQLTASVSPNGADDTISWSSNNTSAATVDEDGKVTAVGKGTATITARAVYAENGASASCTVTVIGGYITLSGTASVTLNGEKLESFDVDIYPDANYNNWITYASVESDGSWSAEMPEFDADTTLYFAIDVYGGPYIHTGQTVTVKDQNRSSIVITVNTQSIILSGTADVTLDGEEPYWVSIMAYANGQQIGWVETNSWDYNNAWEMEIVVNTATTITFMLQADGVYINTGVTRTVSTSDVSGIALSAAITIKTITGTVNLEECYISALSGSITGLDDPTTMTKALGMTDAEDGEWEMRLSSTAASSLWFAVTDFETGNVYITTSAVSTSGTIALNTANMRLIGQVEGGGFDRPSNPEPSEPDYPNEPGGQFDPFETSLMLKHIKQ